MIEITDIGRAYLESCTESAKELVRRRLDDLNPEERRSLFKTIDSLKLILTKINEKKKDDTIQ
jgi:DNA-binding MarR family transcriptional regulator